MPIFLRAISVANAVREWFTFANEAVSWLGVTKRVAAAAVVAAAVVAPVVISKPTATAQQLKEAHQVVQAAEGAQDLGECATGRCSTLYLVENAERMALARRIVSACETKTDVSLEQCDAAMRAVGAFEAVERQERRDAARRKAQAEAPPVGRLTMPWEHKK